MDIDMIRIADDMTLVKDMAEKVWGSMSEDGVIIDNFEPYNSTASVWLIYSENDVDIGMLFINNDSTTAISFHPYIMPEHKGSGRGMVSEFFSWFIENIPAKVNKINVKVPIIHKTVYNFAKKVGFIDEGVDRMSYTKNGEVCDRYALGLTRSEIAEICNGKCSRRSASD